MWGYDFCNNIKGKNTKSSEDRLGYGPVSGNINSLQLCLWFQAAEISFICMKGYLSADEFALFFGRDSSKQGHNQGGSLGGARTPKVFEYFILFYFVFICSMYIANKLQLTKYKLLVA